FFFFFFFNDTATTEIYTLSLHDALPTWRSRSDSAGRLVRRASSTCVASGARSEEPTSELQPHLNLVCRLRLEKKKQASLSYKTLRIFGYGVTQTCVYTRR